MKASHSTPEGHQPAGGGEKDLGHHRLQDLADFVNPQERGGDGNGHGHEDGKDQEDAEVIADLAAPGTGPGDVPGLIEGLLDVGHDDDQVAQQDHHPEDPQRGHLGIFNVIQYLVDEILGAGGEIFQKIGGQEARQADGLEDGEEQGEQGNEAQDGGIGQGRGAHQGLVPDQAAAGQDQKAQSLQRVQGHWPLAFILPEAVAQEVMEVGQQLGQLVVLSPEKKISHAKTQRRKDAKYKVEQPPPAAL